MTRSLNLYYWGVIAKGAERRGAVCVYFDEYAIWQLNLPRMQWLPDYQTSLSRRSPSRMSNSSATEAETEEGLLELGWCDGATR